MRLSSKDWRNLRQHLSKYRDYLLNSHEFVDAQIYSYTIRTLQRDLKDIEQLLTFPLRTKKERQSVFY